MKQKLKSLRVHMLLPVIAMTLFIVILLTTLFSRSYTAMILQQEREINAVGFDTVSRSITPLIESSISEVQSVMTDEPVATYARHQFNSLPELVHARIRCRDYLLDEILLSNFGNEIGPAIKQDVCNYGKQITGEYFAILKFCK